MCKNWLMRLCFTTLTMACGLVSAAPFTIIGGSASFTLTEGVANSIFEFDAYFDASKSRTEVLGDPAPGNATFLEDASGVRLTDPVRPFGEIPSLFPGTPGATRSPQLTTLVFDSDDLLGSWATSNDDFGFVGNTLLGEQIALTSMQRWTGPFPGALIYGDFALRNTASGLVLTSNIDFLNTEFAQVASPVITLTETTLTISGELLIGQGLFLLDPTAVPGTPFGTFILTANLAPVPEPATMVLLVVAGGSVLLRRRLRWS